MIARDALKLLQDGNLSDLELSSDDEDVGSNSYARDTRRVRLDADVIAQNQRQYMPPDSHDENEDESEDEGSRTFYFEPESDQRYQKETKGFCSRGLYYRW